MKPSPALGHSMVSFAVAGRDHWHGPLNAPIMLIEYGDYQCPYCAEAHLVVKDLQSRLGGRLCFVFRHFPLASIHPFAAHAAEAAEAASAQGNFWGMHELLFANQDDLRDEALSSYAREVGLDAGRVLREVMSGAHAARVRDDFLIGIRSGVNGTPSFFINGVRYDGEPDADSLLAALLQAVPPQTTH